MAILTEVPGLDMSIIVNGQALEELFDEDEETQPTEKVVYVESHPGTSFGVQYHFDNSAFPHEEDLQCTIYMDGKAVVSNLVFLKGRHRKPMYEFSYKSCNKNGASFRQKFLFAAISSHNPQPLCYLNSSSCRHSASSLSHLNLIQDLILNFVLDIGFA